MSDGREQQDSVGAGPSREISLDGLRGAAAVVVVVYHGLMSFLPGHCGYYPDLVTPESWALRPWFGLMNGSAAVTVFFVLSAFVLTRPVFATGRVSVAARASVRRYPRLLAPVLASVLASWAIFAAGGYAFAPASAVSGSPWLATFGEADPWPFDTGLAHALSEGTWRTLVLGDSDFNPALWTMRAELLGSLASLGVAAAVVARSLPTRLGALLAAMLVVAFLELGPVVAFGSGTMLAWATAGRRTVMPAVVGIAGAILAVLLLGVNDARGVPDLFLRVLPLDAGMAKATAHAVAGVILVAVAISCAPASRMLSGRTFAFLGTVSLPLYLLHVPVMFSLGSATYLLASGTMPPEAAAGLGILATLIASLALSVPLAPLDRAWVGLLSRRIGRIGTDRPGRSVLRPRP